MSSSLSNPAFTRGFSRDARAYVRPLDMSEIRNPDGTPRFSNCEFIIRDGQDVTKAVIDRAALEDWIGGNHSDLAIGARSALQALTSPRAPLPGLSWDRPLIMGVINVTPDSFSDGGKFLQADAAIEHGRQLAASGADILDIGGESTRPGAQPVSPEEEFDRVAPVIEGLSGQKLISIDTRHATVMQRSIELGAGLINDVSALTTDPQSLAVAAATDVPILLMHARGDPNTMQNDPKYDHALLDVYDGLSARIAACESAGISRTRLIVDPGIGFGKTLVHNVEILNGLSLLHGLGCPVAIGLSRKSMIAALDQESSSEDRLAGSIAGALWAATQGAHIIRVHDVSETRQALAVWAPLSAGSTGLN